ncbi:Hydrolase-4 domain-containing protein [Mycena sanguinolenta]|uniref:Hydrolase-4 domain-containing protein n=1 Tax=Mycena sanguinolenta TaxID=230812 RepID=A0A8H6YDB4_9AGAR|nr:Hydrolase-4 domain-containing protein [Mycena sanguinolenta]
MKFRALLLCLAAATLLLNCISLFLAFRSRLMNSSLPLSGTYTYIADDFPEFWDIGDDTKVAFSVQETEHYPVTGRDAAEEWASYTPKGAGYLRLGPEGREFALAMTHEDHCLRLIRGVLENPSWSKANAMPYCFNYIRQMILCSPNLTLESPDDFADARNFTSRRHGAVHVCRDWRKVHAALADNWEGRDI